MAEYIHFSFAGESPSGKTKIWYVVANSNQDVLGKIKWYSNWRQYAFWPSDSTIWNANCLSAVEAFLIEKNKEHRGD